MHLSKVAHFLKYAMLFAVVGSPANAADGLMIWSNCKGPLWRVQPYVAADVATIERDQNSGKVKKTVCLSPYASLRQLSYIVCRRYAVYPVERDFDSLKTVERALSAEFPCQKEDNQATGIHVSGGIIVGHRDI